MKYFWILILTINLYSCCGTHTRECPEGPKYSDFYSTDFPPDMSYVTQEGESWQLDLTSYREVDAFTLEYDGCDTEGSWCPYDSWYFYTSTWSDPSLVIGFQLYNLGRISTSITYDSLRHVFGIDFDPLQLANSSTYTQSFHTQIELSDIQYSNIIQVHYLDSLTRVKDVFLSQSLGIVEIMVIDRQGEEIVYHKQ